MFPRELQIMFTWCLIGGFACFITSVLVAGYRKPRPTLTRRIEYAAINGLGAAALGFLALKYFPEQVRPEDVPAYAIVCGISGFHKVMDFIAKRVGLDQELQNDTRTKNVH